MEPMEKQDDSITEVMCRANEGASDGAQIPLGLGQVPQGIVGLTIWCLYGARYDSLNKYALHSGYFLFLCIRLYV